MKPLNQFSKNELKEMFTHAVIDKCPVCGKYHIKEDKPKWPLANIWLCEECLEKENENKKLLESWLKNDKSIK